MYCDIKEEKGEKITQNDPNDMIGEASETN